MVVVVVLSVLGAGAHAASVAKPCKTADALASVGRTKDAQTAYLKLLGRQKSSLCAASGLRRLSKRELSIAAALVHAGYRAEAMKEIRMARSARPNVHLPDELRHFVRAQRGFAEVRALDKAGRHEAAKDALDAVLAQYPYGPPGGIPADMRRLQEDRRSPLVHRVQGFLERNTDEGKALVWLLPLLVIVLVVLWEVVHRVRGRPRLSLAPFGGGGGSAEDGEDGDSGQNGSVAANGFAFELQVAIHDVGVELGGNRPDLAFPVKPEEEFPAQLAAAVPQLKVLKAALAVVDRVVPRRDRELKGFLQPANGQGVGASLALARPDGRVESQVTLREGNYGPVAESGAAKAPAPDYEALVEPAAYWVWGATATDSSTSPSDWEAHALFAAGARLQEAGDLEHARGLYERALALQPSIFGAQLDLAVIDLREGSAEPFDAEQVRQAIVRLESLRMLGPRHPDWYRSMYHLVLAYANLAQNDPGDSDSPWQAWTYALELASALEANL